MAGKWDIRRVYLYLVSFTTLMIMVIAAVVFFQGIVNLLYPNPQPGPYPSEIKARYESIVKEDPSITEDKIKKDIEQEQEHQRNYERHSNIRQMLDSLVAILVALPVYLYHWRKIQRAEV